MARVWGAMIVTALWCSLERRRPRSSPRPSPRRSRRPSSRKSPCSGTSRPATSESRPHQRRQRRAHELPAGQYARLYDSDEGFTFNMAEISVKKDPSDKYPFGFGVVFTGGEDAQKNHSSVSSGPPRRAPADQVDRPRGGLPLL